MIPLQLRVRNFMCYRDNVPPLDFSGIHLACLTGANGHGKSALLDAMTWALWGKARARRDDELIHLGQSEMEVEFTFDNRTDALLCFDSSAKDASEAECSAEVRPLKKTTWVPGCGYGTEADKIPLTVVLTVKEGGRQIYQRTEECRIWQKSSRKFIIEQRGEDFVVTDPLTGTTPSP